MDFPSATDLLVQLVLTHYQAHLTPGQSSALREGIARLEYTAQTLRAYPLRHGDEPLMVFRPYRAERE